MEGNAHHPLTTWVHAGAFSGQGQVVFQFNERIPFSGLKDYLEQNGQAVDFLELPKK